MVGLFCKYPPQKHIFFKDVFYFMFAQYDNFKCDLNFISLFLIKKTNMLAEAEAKQIYYFTLKMLVSIIFNVKN